MNPISRFTFHAQIVVRIILGVVLLISGVAKLIDPKAAVDFISLALEIRFSYAMVIVLSGSFLEVTLSFVILHNGSFVVEALVVSCVLFLSFSLLTIITNTDNRECGCFGSIASFSGASFHMKNLGLAGLSILALKYSDSKEQENGKHRS